MAVRKIDGSYSRVGIVDFVEVCGMLFDGVGIRTNSRPSGSHGRHDEFSGKKKRQ